MNNDNVAARQIQKSERTLDYNIIPNIFKGSRIGLLTLDTDEKGYVEIYSIAGLLMEGKQLTAGTNVLDLNTLSKGIFVYKVHVNGEIKTHDKLVVVE